MRILKWIILFIILFLNLTLSAQDFTSEKCIWLKVFNKPFEADSLSIITSSIKLLGLGSEKCQIVHSLNTGQLTITSKTPPDSIQLCYKTLGISFHNTIYLRNPQEYDSNALFFNPIIANSLGNLAREELFVTESIYKSGSLSRGLSLGNTQNIFVNSNFNLQMEGKLTDDLNIRAAITDQNIPYQPEGNSQRVQDFDNVFVQVYNDKISLTAGDVILQQKTSHYLKYYKNVQGIFGVYKHPFKNGHSERSLGVSVAKGKFATNQLTIQEGISGPYRLRGSDNERFIIVLANSEKVFLDGKQLQRGFDYDYIIDYNTGEITFTSRVLITKFSRVRVDYEYSVQNYARSIVAANHYQEGKKFDFYINYYQEKDNRNRPLFYDLNDGDKQVLSDAGDNLNAALISGIDSVGYVPDQILYLKKDTIDLNGNLICGIYKYSDKPDSAIYRLTFTEVGEGNGNYKLGDYTLNGRVYEWVSPVDGHAQGSFEPGILLQAPNMKQMMIVGARYKITKNDAFTTEIAYSKQDVNLYSNLNANDDQGKSYMFSYDKTRIGIGKRFLSTKLQAEIIEQNFKAIDRFRDIDFDRDWNLPLTYAPANDQIYFLQTQLSKNAQNQILYQLTRRERIGQLKGWQQSLIINEEIGNLHNIVKYSSLYTEQTSFNSEWHRLSAETSWRANKFMPGYEFSLDRNRNFKTGSDSLFEIANAFYYHQNRVFIRSGDSTDGNFLLDYAIRYDKKPVEGVIKNSDEAQTFNLSWQSKSFNHGNVSSQLIYRTISNLLDSNNNAEETLMGRLDWNWEPIRRVLRSDLTYAIANGRELKREYTYFQVATGDGTHTWVDQNENGVQELNEFYEAITFDQKNYVKIFTPTDEYIAAYSQIFNYRINIEAPIQWRSQGGFTGFLSKFSNTSFWNSDRKTTDNQLLYRFSPFHQLPDSSLLANKSYFKTTTFINKSHPAWGADFTFGKSHYKQLLTAGFEARDIQEFKFNYRLNFGSDWSGKVSTSKILKVSDSDFLAGRNYSIQHYSISPELSWQPNPDFRLMGAYLWSDKLNLIGLEEAVTFNEYILESRWAKSNVTNINGRIKLSDISFNGVQNTAVAFDMLEALRDGRNISWSINWLQKLSNGLQLTIVYEGRKSPDVDLINIGRAQLTLLF